MKLKLIIICLLGLGFTSQQDALEFLSGNTPYKQCSQVVIGILANPNPSDGNNYVQARIDKNYVDWLQSSGARVVPLSPLDSTDALNSKMAQLNGVLFQGGGRTLAPGGAFENFAQNIINKIIQQNEKGNRIALWGTCQGFEMTQMLFSTLTGRHSAPFFQQVNGTESVVLPTIETPLQNGQRWLLRDYLAVLSQFDNFTSLPVNGHFHGWSIMTSAYTDGKSFKNNYITVTSTQKDVNGLEFVDTYQGAKINGTNQTYNIYGLQFHPEKLYSDYFTQSVWNQSYVNMVKANKTNNLTSDQMLAIAKGIAKSIGDFFVQQARASTNVYCSDDDNNRLEAIDMSSFMKCTPSDNFQYSYMYAPNTPQKPICVANPNGY